MQIITRPLSGVPVDTSIKLSSRERSRLTLTLLVTALFLAFLGLILYTSSGSPDLGVTVGTNAEGRQVVTWVVPYGIAYDQNVRTGDIVLSDSGQGGLRTVTVSKADNPSQQLTANTRLQEPMSPLQRWSFIILALIFIGVGGPVYVKARHRVAASAFYAFCLASAVCLVVATSTSLGYGWVTMLMFISLMLWSASFAFFFLKFPVRVGRTKSRHRTIISFTFVLGAISIGTYLWIFAFHPDLYQTARTLGYIYISFCAILGLASLGHAFLKESSTEVRQQMTIVLGGTALAVGPTLLLGILPSVLWGTGHGIRVDFTALTLGLMPLSFAYAITQGQMLGVRNFIRRGVVYVLMGFGVLLAFSLVGGALSAIVPKGWLDGEIGWIGFSLFVFLIALSYGYVQKFVERMVDRYIYHDAYDYKQALLQFSAQLAAEQNLATLADELVLRTCRMMNLSCGVLLLTTPADKSSSFQNEMLLNDMDLMDADADNIWGVLRDSSSVLTSQPLQYSSNGNGVAHHNGVDGARSANSHGTDNETAPLRVVPYARYGDFADWLIDGLHYELSQLGIRLDEADAPMQLIYFNHHNDSEDTSRLRTQQLREDAVQSEMHATITGALRNGSRTTGSLGSYVTGHLNSIGDSHSTGAFRKPDPESMRSFLGVPLWTRSRFVGVLCLGGKRTGERFTRDDLSLLSTLGSQAALAIYNAQLYEAREQALLDTIGALAHAIEAKDGYTIQHCENMTGRALALAQAMGLPPKEVENIRMGAILHDIGKIGIPDAVLNKPGRLTSEEYELMKQHAAIGARIVQSVGALQGVVPIVRYHQERYDGSGYPEGLKGEDIPIGARIIGVVDTYGAMTEDRVYRATPGHDKALAELQLLAGKQFDPTVVEAFIQLLEERPDLAERPTLRAL
jgi:putative nucleotidyltransferase with HDIG domain